VRLEHLQGVLQRRRGGQVLALAEVACDRTGHLLQGRDGFGLGVEGPEVCLQEAVEQVQPRRVPSAQSFERESLLEFDA